MFPLGVLGGGEAADPLDIQFNGLPFIDATGNHPLQYPVGVTESGGSAVFNNNAANFISVLRSGYRLQNSIEVNCRVNLTNNGGLQSIWTMLDAAGAEVFRLFVTAIGEIGFYMGTAIPVYFGFTYGVSTELKVQYDKVAHTLKLYKNGVLVLTEVGVALQANVQRSMRIGNFRTANPFPMNGTMDYITVAEF